MRTGSIAAHVLAAGVLGLALVARRGVGRGETSRKYGGTLEVGTVYATLSALSWDLADWNWKQNHDTGQFYEQLFAADLSKIEAQRRQASVLRRRLAALRRHPRRAGGKLGVEGEPAAHRDQAAQGHHVPGEAGRDGGARADRRRRRLQLQPPGQQPEEDRRPTSTTSTRSRRPTSTRSCSHFKEFNAEWDYRFGWGYYSGIMPKEVADAGAGNWKNVNGTGPFMLTDFVQGNSNTYAKNPIYWDKEKIDGGEYKLPVRRQARLPHHQGRGDLRHRAAHRQARHAGDHPLAERRAAEEERAAAASGRSGSTCRARSWRCASTPSRSTTSACAARSTWRSTSRRSSRAYYNGNAELFAYPQHPDYNGYFEPLEAMPDSVKELFDLQPGQGQEAAGRGRLSQRLHLQGAGLLLQSRPHGSAAAGRRLSGEGRRQDRDPAHGVRARSSRP